MYEVGLQTIATKLLSSRFSFQNIFYIRINNALKISHSKLCRNVSLTTVAISGFSYAAELFARGMIIS